MKIAQEPVPLVSAFAPASFGALPSSECTLYEILRVFVAKRIRPIIV